MATSGRHWCQSAAQPPVLHLSSFAASRTNGARRSPSTSMPRRPYLSRFRRFLAGSPSSLPATPDDGGAFRTQARITGLRSRRFSCGASTPSCSTWPSRRSTMTCRSSSRIPPPRRSGPWAGSLLDPPLPPRPARVDGVLPRDQSARPVHRLLARQPGFDLPRPARISRLQKLLRQDRPQPAPHAARRRGPVSFCCPPVGTCPAPLVSPPLRARKPSSSSGSPRRAVLLSYTMSGVGKLAAALYQLFTGQTNAFSPGGLERASSLERLTSRPIPPAFFGGVDHPPSLPDVARPARPPCYLELFAFLVAFRPGPRPALGRVADPLPRRHVLHDDHHFSPGELLSAGPALFPVAFRAGNPVSTWQTCRSIAVPCGIQYLNKLWQTGRRTERATYNTR